MGRDFNIIKKIYIIWSFNPRARMGRDRYYVLKFAFRTVSTHAPAWGATQRSAVVGQDVKFQPTRPHGARPLLCA